MPEYLSPGVFVEEVPGRFKALEGVSTSTAAFVGPSARGTVAGFPLPFTPTGGFVLNPDPAPVFITSFAEFTRQFGFPLPLISQLGDPDYGYLAHAVRNFFDNGGKRSYIARIIDLGATHPGDARSTHRLKQGNVYRLTKPALNGDTVVAFRSLRKLNEGDTIEFRRRSDGSNALLVPATSATVVGDVTLPLSLLDSDDFTVTIAPAGPVTVNVTGVAVTSTSNSLPPASFPLTALTVDVIVSGGATQSVVIASAANLADLANQLSAGLTGVQVFTGVDTVSIRTDRKGSNATLNISVTGAGLTFGPPSANTSNVPDLSAVTVADLIALLPGTETFTLSQDAGTGTLLITSDNAGSGVTVGLSASGGNAMLGRFGLAPPGVVNTPGAGGGAAPSFTIDSYNTLAGTVTLNTAVTGDLDPNEVYAVETGASLGANGPKFYARSPGQWSEDVSVEIQPADRGPVPVTAATALPTTSEIEVRSTTSFYVGAIIEIDHNGETRTYHEVTAITGKKLTLGTQVGTPLLAPPPPGTPPAPGHPFARVVEIDVIVADESGAAPVEVYRGLSWNQSPIADVNRHYATTINARSRLVFVRPPGTGVGLAPGDVAVGNETGVDANQQPTTGNGYAERMSSIPTSDFLPSQTISGDGAYIGTDGGPGLRTGIESLRDLNEVRIVAAPGRTTQAVQLALISQCELMRYRFAILDAPPDVAEVGSVLAHRNLYDTSFAAYYAPWLGMSINGQIRYLPPSGHMAGIYARVDNRRGFWKAPANETPFNVISLKTNYTTGEQDILNPRGVNLIRRFDQGGIRVWGARTLSSDPEVKYINVRRTLIFIEATIDRNTQWVVFEPNNQKTWATVTASIAAFLETQWREGALFGRSSSQAYFVRCDETTMTVDDIQNGRLICQIGVAIVRPAEFVIFRIEQLTGFAKQ